MKGLALAALLIASAAYGQTVEQIDQAQGAIKVQEKVLATAFGNLQGMAIGQDTEVVGSINNTVNVFRLGYEPLIAVSNLVRHLKDKYDAGLVRIQLQYSLGRSLSLADISVNAMNGYLTMVKAPAALAEATKARDAMVEVREQLRSLKTDGT
jgi:hypothetical protein